MDQKIEFINEWKSGKHTFQSLCEAFGISRTLGYKLCRRYEAEKEEGLLPKSRAPHRVHNKTLTEVEMAICDLRLKYKRFGADKIISILRDDYGMKELPAVSTAHLILKRNGFIKPRKRIRRIIPIKPIFDPKACNEVWSADFKGHFRTRNGLYCYPLTIADSYSRFVFKAKGMLSPSWEACQRAFTEVFREWGMPLQLHTDNGLPFGCATSLCRLTQLAVWFIELGIEPVYSDPGHPEQNGRHERMHLELKGEATRPPAYDLRSQQRKLNAFLHLYNHIRPHDALEKQKPGRVHVRSERSFPERIREWDYPKEFKERYVCRNGAIRWGHSNWVGVSTALKEKRVGLEELGDGIWRVYFRQKSLGYFDERVRRIQDKKGRVAWNRV